MKMNGVKMNKFKEMIIPKPKIHTLPKLELSGRWLDEIGFPVGTLVSISYRDSCLTLATKTTENSASVLVVEAKQVRNRTRTILTLNGLLLKRYGFNTGDRIGLYIVPNQIQISKINRFTVAN